MIASVRGTLVTRLPGDVVIEAAGVGYRLNVSTETLAGLPKAGDQAMLLTHLILRDDGMHLYGFATRPSASCS